MTGDSGRPPGIGHDQTEWAVTIGRNTHEVGLIAALYLHAAHAQLGAEVFAYPTFTGMMLDFAPFVLLAYLTWLLGADMSIARVSMRKLSETDDLTGLSNMRAFTAALEREIRKAEVAGTPFGVMMIDADGLKPINDNNGHDAGNHMILHIVSAIHRGLRASDMVVRYDGDEFVVIVPDADHDTVAMVAERVRQSVGTRPWISMAHPCASRSASDSPCIRTRRPIRMDC